MAYTDPAGIPTNTAVNPAVPAQPTQQTVPIVQAPTYTPGQNFSFDPNQYLPGIQAQASSIYDPQKAQIDALNKISQAQTANTKITTEKQFQDELTARIEAINARGAFFGGGAITQQNDIGTAKTSALTQIDLQQQAADLASQAQQAGLNVSETQYMQDQLTGAKNSAYSMWSDAYQRDFQQQQAKQAQDNADRQYQMQKDAIKADKKKSKSDKKKAQKALDEQKREFDLTLQEKYASNKSSAASSAKPQAYIDKNGNVVELPAGYNYVGGLGQLNQSNSSNPFGN